MRIFRVYRDADEVFELVVNDGSTLKAIYATQATTSRQLDSCGSSKAQTTYSIRCVANRCFVEKWENEFHRQPKDRTGWRKVIAWEIGEKKIKDLMEVIKGLYSDSDDVVETYETVKQYVEDFDEKKA